MTRNYFLVSVMLPPLYQKSCLPRHWWPVGERFLFRCWEKFFYWVSFNIWCNTVTSKYVTLLPWWKILTVLTWRNHPLQLLPPSDTDTPPSIVYSLETWRYKTTLGHSRKFFQKILLRMNDITYDYLKNYQIQLFCTDFSLKI